jgi:hypothetical protein
MQVTRRWDRGSRWPAATLVIVLGLALGALVAGALAQTAELNMAMQQAGQLVTAANAWLSTTAAQAFTMQCTHAVPR